MHKHLTFFVKSGFGNFAEKEEVIKFDFDNFQKFDQEEKEI